MNLMRKSAFALAVAVLVTPAVFGQDLSRYRKFALGTSVATISKQVGQGERQPTLLAQSPALVQELTYWQVEAGNTSDRVEPVSHISFNFYNGELYRIVVTYDRSAIEGLTEEDMVTAISARYGAGVMLYPEIDFPGRDVYAQPDKVVARWTDAQNSVSFMRSTGTESFGLVVLSKLVNAKAEAAIAESVRVTKEEAPQKEIDRQKKEVDDRDVTRQKNIKSFRP